MRNTEIDGIRGWAAFFVLIFHFYHEVFEPMIPALGWPVFGLVFSGELAVMVFFILSGDALSSSFFKSQNYQSLVRLTVTRYFRLTFLILVTCLAVYVLMKVGLNFNTSAAKVLIGQENWLGSFINFSETFSSFIEYTFYGVYFNHTKMASYNPFLWTMSIELLGSMIIFLNLFLFHKIKKPIVLVVCQVIFFWAFNSFFMLFLVGMLLAWYRQEFTSKNFKSRIPLNTIANMFFLISVIAISILSTSDKAVLGISVSKFVVHNRAGFLWAILLVSAIYCSFELKVFFRSRFSRFLGDLSFPMYASHFAILISFTSWAVVKLEAINQLSIVNCLLVSSASVVLTLCISSPLFWLERLYLRNLKSVYVKYLSY